ncbi:MAG: CARDB domain-containing protein [Candidatus Bathycorpusculaceae bacterium]
MCARPKKLAVTLTMISILLSFTLANMKFAHLSDAGGKIDLFTQKEPYSGKGPNMPSDAFGPEELVILYALVTYNGTPIQNLLVAFHVQTPSNASFSLSERTNASGIATINFTLPWPCINESEVFGEWYAFANALVGDRLLQDSLTFRVGRVVELISVRTIDENLTYRRYFGIGGDVGLEITLRSIAMSVKKATLAIAVQDELNVPINHLEIPNLEVQPNEKLIYLYGVLNIPKWAHVGNATVFVSALTALVNQSGVPYCPAISTKFYIMPYTPLTITFHDVAVVDVVPSAKSVEVGQIVNISAIIQNEGTENESFNVNAYYNNVTIGTLRVTALAPYSHLTLNFTFDTSTVDPGNYTITVSIPYLVNEVDFRTIQLYNYTDNVFVDGIIKIKPKLPIVIHDIAVVDVKVSKEILYIGEMLQINVSVINKGTETETFDVRTYYDSSLIETLQVSALAPNNRVTLTFVWNTSFVHEGFYLISASAPLTNDINPADNTFVNGIVQVTARPPYPQIHDVAVLNVSPLKTLVYIGEVGVIYVVVKNEGTYVESFYVTAFYDSNVVGKLFVNGLEHGREMLLVFYWDTLNVTEGNYTLSAEASAVPGEVNIENNKLVDGVIWVKPWMYPPVWKIPIWLLALLFLLAMLIGILLLLVLICALLRRRRRKKKDKMVIPPIPHTIMPFQRSKKCKVCGKEFPGVYTFCPYCFTFHGKDYK